MVSTSANYSIISFEDVTFYRKEKYILKNISFHIKTGEHWVVLGPNGAGKSTLLSLANAYLWSSQGNIFLFNKKLGQHDVQSLREKISFFQPKLQSNLEHYHPQMTTLDVILSGYDSVLGKYKEYPSQIVKRASKLFHDSFQNSYSLSTPFFVLSSGEKYKTLLLRAFVSNKRLLLLDEPYASLDIPSQYDLENLLCNYVKNKTHKIEASVCILHRLEEIPSFATHIAFLKKGELLYASKIKPAMNAKLLSELYGIDLEVFYKENRYFCIPKTKRS